MHIEKSEKIFLGLGVVLMVLALIAIGASVFASNIHLPAPTGRVDARTVAETPPFDTPGYREVEPGKYEAIIRAYRFGFLGFDYDSETQTSSMTVPAGSEITFKLVSTDVVHGFMINDTAINAMVIPGQITTVTQTFDEPGEYLVVCHEYCGAQHHLMYAKVVVV